MSSTNEDKLPSQKPVPILNPTAEICTSWWKLCPHLLWRLRGHEVPSSCVMLGHLCSPRVLHYRAM